MPNKSISSILGHLGANQRSYSVFWMLPKYDFYVFNLERSYYSLIYISPTISCWQSCSAKFRQLGYLRAKKFILGPLKFAQLNTLVYIPGAMQCFQINVLLLESENSTMQCIPIIEF